VNPILVQGDWREVEDQGVIKHVEQHGEKAWNLLATESPWQDRQNDA
jgi:hypothetical protein